MKIISTEKAPGAIGPYSQGYTVGGLVFTSGQIPVCLLYTSVEGHLTVLHGQGPLAVVGLVGMEHGAVGVKVGGVDAVGQSSLCRRFGSCLAHGGGSRRLGGSGRAGRGAGCAAAGERTSQHSAGQQKKMCIRDRCGDGAAHHLLLGPGGLIDHGGRGDVYKRQLLSRSAMVCNCGLPNEEVWPDLADYDPARSAGYFATILVKEG